jgi:serine/threonine protein kinase
MSADKILYDIVVNNEQELKKFGILDNKTTKSIKNYLEHGKTEPIILFENYEENIKQISQYIADLTKFDVDIIVSYIKHIFGDTKTGLDSNNDVEYVKKFCEQFDNDHTILIETDDIKNTKFTDEYLDKICSFISDKRKCTLTKVKTSGCHSLIYENNDNTITKIYLSDIKRNDFKVKINILEDYCSTMDDINSVLINYILCALLDNNCSSEIKEMYLVKCKSKGTSYEKIVTVIDKINHNLEDLFDKHSKNISQIMFDNIFQKIIKLSHQIYQNTSLIHCDLKPDNILINTDNLSDIEANNFELCLIDFGLASINNPRETDNINGYYGYNISSGADILFYLMWIYKHENNFIEYSKKWIDIMFEYSLCQIEFNSDNMEEFDEKITSININNKSAFYDSLSTHCKFVHDISSDIVNDKQVSIPINLWDYITNKIIN